MKSREEVLAYKREWNARYLKSAKYEERKAEARARTAAWRASDECRIHLERRRQEKLQLKRVREAKYRKQMTAAEKASAADSRREWRKLNADKVSAYNSSRKEYRAATKKRHRKELRDHYIKEQLGLRNPPDDLVVVKRLQLQIKRLLEDTNEEHRAAS